MKELIKKLRRKILYSYRADAAGYARRLNRMGARIDENIRMSVPESVRLDETTPYMLEIGENVWLAEGVSILTHDASWLILKREDGEIRGHIGPVKIGNNVFVGVKSTILCNVTICDNVIIGADTVVSSSIKKPGVYAGNPARFVMSLEQMKALRESRQVQEAYKIVRSYYQRFHKEPPKEILSEYFWIFEKRDPDRLPEEYVEQMAHGGNAEESLTRFLGSEAEFDGYEDFLAWCRKRMGKEKLTAERKINEQNG